MEFAAFPKRFDDAAAAERKDATPGLTSLTKMVAKSYGMMMGTYVKKPSKQKPKIHDRSFKPCDINNYIERCKIMRIEPSIDHDFEEFFDHIGGSSSLSRQHTALPKRNASSHGQGSRFESLPTPRSERRFGRHGAKVAPYEVPVSSSKYASGIDIVDASAHWIIKSRSQLRKHHKRRRGPKAASLLPPEVDSTVYGDEKDSTGNGSRRRRGRGGRRYSRLDDVLAKEHELYPVPPKLPTMKMRRKVDLQSYSTAPKIGDTEEDDGEDKEDEKRDGGNNGEIVEEEEEKLREVPPENVSDRRRGDDHVSSMVFGEEKEEDEEEGEEADGKAEEGSREVEREEGDDDEEDGKFVEFVHDVWDNSDRVSVGMKLTRWCFGFSTTSPTQKVISRPYFTVWITIIQMIIYFVIIGQYGIAPVGVDWTEQTADVLMTDLTIQHQGYMERPNLWVGPREADLIHLGAKFSPCIRPDKNIEALLGVDRKKEATTGCCINNDGSGCVQRAKNECPNYLSTWKQSTVCGEDPRYCVDPRGPWDADITTWPQCKNASKTPPGSTDYHMMCAVVGRPCCVGVRGECVMVTREYCDFRRGYFHENASLCSQVSCLEEVCGMIRFTDPKKPDQFYRFFTSLCIHPGLLALVMTVVFQWLIQYDLERYIGWWSMTTIYVVCGYCGSILSAIFIPYYVEAGPSGSQFGVLAAMSVEIVRWNAEEKPRAQLAMIFVCLLILFFIGVIVPQVDNWAHLGGYVVGAILAVAFRPFEHLCGNEVPNYCRVVTRVMCFLWTAALAAILTVVFCLIEVTECRGCQYFNCIPFTDTYCMGMGVNISSLSN